MRGSQDDINARGPLCRVILNNGTTTIVQIRNSETIQQFINRLLEKRGLSYTSFEVFTDKHHKVSCESLISSLFFDDLTRNHGVTF